MKPCVKKLFVFALAAVAGTLLLPDSGICQKKNLRWNLKKGERLLLEIQQRSKSTRSFKNNELVVSHDTTMQIEWEVTDVNDKGAAIKQTFRALKISLDAPNARGVEYDTASDERPSGNARILAEALKPLMGTPVNLQLDTRGEVIDAKLSEEASQAVKHAVASAGAPGLISKEGMQQVLNQAIFKMPENPVAKGDQWKDSVVKDTPFSKLNTLHTYTYLGDKETGEGVYDSIGVVTKLDVERKGDKSDRGKENQGQKREFSHEQSGEMLFDSNAGRPVSSKIKQKFTSSRTIEGLEVTMSSESDASMTVKPLKTATLEK